MPEKFKVNVVTPKGVLLDKDVEEIIAPGVMGEFGVLVGHTPMLTFLKPGVISYLENDRFIKYAVGGGLCEVLPKSVTILVDEGIKAEEIVSAEAQEDLNLLTKELAMVDGVANPEEYQRVSARLALAKVKAELAGSGS